MGPQRDLTDLLERYKLNAKFLDRQVLHTFYVAVPNREHGKMMIKEEWHDVQEIGRGSLGDVWLQKCVTKTRAVKVLRKAQLDRQRIDYRRELEAMAKFADRFPTYKEDVIVKFFGWYESVDKVYLAMEYFQHGDLGLYITTGEITESDAKNITIDLLEALKAIHAEGFAHRDLKPQNIFVATKSPTWRVKVGDFGITKRVNSEQTAFRTETGTPLFMAPEIIPDDEDQSSEYSNAVDIWSIGCVVYNMLAGEPPFRTHRSKSHPFPRAPLENGAGLAAIPFLEAVLVLDPTKRVEAEVALEHRWLQTSINEQISHDGMITASSNITLGGAPTSFRIQRVHEDNSTPSHPRQQHQADSLLERRHRSLPMLEDPRQIPQAEAGDSLSSCQPAPGLYKFILSTGWRPYPFKARKKRSNITELEESSVNDIPESEVGNYSMPLGFPFGYTSQSMDTANFCTASNLRWR